MQKILVIDYGSQYTHLITSRLRNLGVYAEIFAAPNDFGNNKEDLNFCFLKNQVLSGNIKGIILSGGPNSVYDDKSPIISKDKKVVIDFFDLGIPILGICYGHQLIAYSLGGRVESGTSKEYGSTEVSFNVGSKIFKGLKEKSIVWMSHGDEVVTLPLGFKNVANVIGGCGVVALENKEKNIFTLQFHPEVKHTKEGKKILQNFIDICGIRKEWSMKKFLKHELEEVKLRVGNKNIFLFISGGVDSTVAYFILKEAVGADRIYPVFVDTGFMRKNEKEKVEFMLKNAGVKHLKLIDASKKFLYALKGIKKPEEKRKIIGDLFIQIQKDVVKELKLDLNNWLLGQGTIYPDTIESGATKHADKIKTHHNRVPEIEEMIKKGLVIEPLSKLYKDEVRKIGKLLGLSDELIWRHPFPGPGLAVRILC